MICDVIRRLHGRSKNEMGTLDREIHESLVNEHLGYACTSTNRSLWDGLDPSRISLLLVLDYKPELYNRKIKFNIVLLYFVPTIVFLNQV